MQLTVTSASMGTSYALFAAVVFSPVNVAKGAYVDIRFSGNVANTISVPRLVGHRRDAATRRGGLAFQIIPGLRATRCVMSSLLM